VPKRPEPPPNAIYHSGCLVWFVLLALLVGCVSNGMQPTAVDHCAEVEGLLTIYNYDAETTPFYYNVDTRYRRVVEMRDKSSIMIGEDVVLTNYSIRWSPRYEDAR